MAAIEVSNTAIGIENLNLSDKINEKGDQTSYLDEECKEKWGFSLEEVYKIALKFFKGKCM